MRIFTFPANYEAGALTYEADSSYAQGDLAPQLSDGRDDTFNTNAYYVMDFAGTEQKPVNAIFCETTGYDNISYNIGGESGSARQINADAQRRGVRHYAFIPLLATHNVTQAQISFGGGPGRIYRVALCRQLIYIDTPRWQGVAHRRVGEGIETRRNIVGNTVVIASRAGRWKTTTVFTGLWLSGDTPTAEQLIATIERGPAFWIYPLPTSQPTIFYPCAIDPASVSIDYVGRQFNQVQMEFTVREL